MGLGIINRTLILRWPRGGTDSAGVQGCGISRSRPDFLREVLIAIAIPAQPDTHRTQWLGELCTLAFRGMLNVQSTNPRQFVCRSSSFLRFSMLEKKSGMPWMASARVSSSVSSLSFIYGFYFFKCTSFFFAGAVKSASCCCCCKGEGTIIRGARCQRKHCSDRVCKGKNSLVVQNRTAWGCALSLMYLLFINWEPL